MIERQDDILIRLKENPNEVMVEMYRDYRKEFLSWAFKYYGAGEEDAMDCFQDAMIVFYRNVVNQKITTLSSSEKTYLFSIGKNLLLRIYKSKRNEVPMSTDNIEDPVIDDWEFGELFTGSSRAEKVAKIVKKLKDPCQSILRYFYFRGLSMEEIAEKMEYKNSQTVKAQKVRCIKELKNIVQKEMRLEP